ncbi:MAG: UDP-N-acetylglucosamine 1-carboxyvinyltransferase [Fimbriimonadales bacterium]|nr:UDP-N-acetylglucosamine 1-carboxyvinyltransferase [Fimbriimonadales bacterium]MDW8051676.1 UDP-N-acetylglucosamine 1-carboxyvinyltransferase [Armatimonadota bacterium]
MESYRITGGTPLHGAVSISGSKNAALALMAGALLIEGEVVLHNVPRIGDVFTMIALLEGLGVRTAWEGNSLYLDTRTLHHAEPDARLVNRMRASFYIFGPLLARLGYARMPHPGGCQIGTRPVNFHINGLRALGATIEPDDGIYVAHALGLTGARIYLDMPSAGATQQLMAAAVYASGLTVIENAAMEPEVVNLANFLNAAGARIEGAGTSTLYIYGVPRLAPYVEYPIIPDRLEAGTFAIAAAITQGEVELNGVVPEHLHALSAKLTEAGVEVYEGAHRLIVRATRRPKPLDIRTMPYPGFPTDLQQPMCAFLALAEGASKVLETIYENRIQHVPELQKMGADIVAEGRTILIRGVDKLKGARVRATDLRGGAALVVAALAAQGETVVDEIEHIDRGYERLESKLQALGAQIQRVQLPAETPPAKEVSLTL